VARTGPQTHPLFDPHPFHTYQSWLSTISPTNTGVLRHVRSLQYFHHHQKPSDPRRGVYSLRDYLPSFSHLHTLTFRNFDVEETIPDHLEIFSAFQHTLSSSSLVHVSITWSKFVALFGYFPRLRHLEVRRVLFRVDDRPAPQMNHALRGRMVIDQLDNEGLKPFIDWFSGLRAEYEELVMLGPCEHRMVAAVGANLRFLEINLSAGMSLVFKVEPRQLFTYRCLPGGTTPDPRVFQSSVY
jgi:hypothetical protein